MNNPFQDQLLKAGLVNKQQVEKAKKEKFSQKKQQRNKQLAEVNTATITARQSADEKAKRDRALNQKKEQQARQKAISAEINQLITDNLIVRDDSCEIVYNFEHRNKVRRLYINAEMKQQIIRGHIGIACIDGRYELVPGSIAEKIEQRDQNRVVLFKQEIQKDVENDPYADYQVPDDLVW